jgi:uncharacterized protein YkwD
MKTYIKIFLHLTFFLLVNNIFSQTELDYTILKKLNEYRKENGLNTLVWSDKAFKASEHHSKYMDEKRELTHNEDSPTPSLNSRMWHYGITDNLTNGEICCLAYTYGVTSIDSVAIIILDAWKNSKGHNKIMLNPYYEFAGSSCLYKTKECKWFGERGYGYTTMVLFK